MYEKHFHITEWHALVTTEAPDHQKNLQQDILLETRKGAALSYAPAQIAI